jgi:hypothetical protein
VRPVVNADVALGYPLQHAGLWSPFGGDPEGGQRADGAGKGRVTPVNNDHSRSTTVTRKPILTRDAALSPGPTRDSRRGFDSRPQLHEAFGAYALLRAYGCLGWPVGGGRAVI